MHQFLHPAVIQLKGGKFIFFLHLLMCVIQRKRLIQHVIFIHCAGSIGINLTELKTPVFLIEKNIESGNRKQRIIKIWYQNQLFQFLRKRKILSVRRIIQIFPYHFRKYPVRSFYDPSKICNLFLGENLWYMKSMHY